MHPVEMLAGELEMTATAQARALRVRSNRIGQLIARKPAVMADTTLRLDQELR